MRKQILISLLALSIISGALFLKTTLAYPSASLPAATRISKTITAENPVNQSCNIKPSSGETCSGAIPSGCSIFTVSKGDRVFFGGNDDSINPDSYYWVDPGGAQGYGAIWIGTPDNVMQGVNEKGLAYDANGLPRVDVNPHLEREPVTGGYSSYPIQILRECATVEEVIAWVNTHQWHSYMWDQLHFADATGDAVIISVGADSELAFTRKPHGDGYLVSTNFNVANPMNGYGYPCWRYETAKDLLGGLVSQESELTVQDATHVLDAVHVEVGGGWTIESLVADLPNGIVYLYYFYQYDKPIVLNVAEEIATKRAGGSLSNLFPEDVKQEAARRYQNIQSQKKPYEMLGQVWLSLVVTSMAIFLVVSIKQRNGWIFWIPVVVITGPLGLLVWLVTGCKPGTGNWRTALVEATGDITPTIVAFVATTIGLVQFPEANTSQPLQLLIFFLSPLFIGLFLFQAPLLASITHKGYWLTFLHRLPHTWVAANLGIAGIFALATPLVNMSLLIPLPPWIGVAWWAFAVLGALAGMLLLLLFDGWSVKRKCRFWYSLAWGEGVVALASWRKLWWWILLSYIVLIGGVVTYAFLQQLLSG